MKKNKCLHCYEILSQRETDFHDSCALAFFNQKKVPPLPYKFSEMEKLATEAALQSVTVPGVQPKLSLGYIKAEIEDGYKGRLTIMDALEGNYILKPQNSRYPEMPENEHLSMKLAELFKIKVVPFSMIRLKSGELCYLTKRIDREENGTKIHMIDFLQIMELEDKYKGTMERLGKLIGDLSENTLFDKLRFFELSVFNYIIGNNDMHLKNFSMYLSDIGWVLSPAYDLLNVKIILPTDKEDVAIMLGGKKENFSSTYFNRLGENLKLNEKQIAGVYKRLEDWRLKAVKLIEKSFLSSENKVKYLNQLEERVNIFINNEGIKS
jgi:serine/threonine-protein kinase HipA